MSSGAPGWPFSAALGGYYWYDARSDTITLVNGRHFPRPESVPREALLRECPQNVTFQYSGSPPREPEYSYSGGNDARPPAQTRAGRDAPPEPQNPTIVSSQRQQPNPMQTPRTQPQETRAAAMANIEERLSGLNVQAAPPPQSTKPSPEEIPRPVTAVVRRDQGGDTYYSTQDPRSHVRTVWQSGPADRITDPYLLGHGITAKMRLIGTDDDEERLFASFKKVSHATKFFKVGKVFMMLWVEPAGESTVTYLQAGESLGRFGERVYSKVRRFVVIREAQGYCSALPITTYGRRGVSKPGVVKSEHAIIYTGKPPGPAPLKAELPGRGEEPMRPRAIRVDPDSRDDSLDVLSRIDFGRVTTVQHNIKVKSFGMVNRASMDALEQQAKNVWWKESESKRDDQMSGTMYSRAPDPPEAPAPTRAFVQARVGSSGSAESGPSSRARDSVLSNSGSVSGVAARRPSQAGSVADAVGTRGAPKTQPNSTVIRRPMNTRTEEAESSSEESGSEESDDDDDEIDPRAAPRAAPHVARGLNAGQLSGSTVRAPAVSQPAPNNPTARPSVTSQGPSTSRQATSGQAPATVRPSGQAPASGRQTASAQAPPSNRQPAARQLSATSQPAAGVGSYDRPRARRCTRHGVENCRSCYN